MQERENSNTKLMSDRGGPLGGESLPVHAKTNYSLRPFFSVDISILGCPLINVCFEKLMDKSLYNYFCPFEKLVDEELMGKSKG